MTVCLLNTEGFQNLKTVSGARHF